MCALLASEHSETARLKTFNAPFTEAEFLDVLGTKVLRFFLLFAVSQSPLTNGFYPPPPRNLNKIVKLYVHEFGFRSKHTF
jgi:hypothetical protein